MRHCCKFKSDEIYFLYETSTHENRKLSFGYCPICNKAVAELSEKRFDGVFEEKKVSGIKALNLIEQLKTQIQYSRKEIINLMFKAKPYGWKYGINKVVKINGKECIKQYAKDFYGNKELVKIS